MSDLVAGLTVSLPELIGPTQMANVLGAAAYFPRALSDLVGIEGRLGKRHGAVDFMFRVAAPAQRTVLSNLLPFLPTDISAHPAWHHVSEFATVWADPNRGYDDQVPEVWLEFDLDLDSPGALIPSIFIEFGSEAARQESGDLLFHEIVSLLLGGPLDQGMGRRMAECLCALPSVPTILKVGVMLGRQSDFLRLGVQGLRRVDIDQYLEAIGWSGPHIQLKTVFDVLNPVIDYVTVDLDVGTKLHTRVGIEYMFAGRRRHRNSLNWRPPLNALVDLGLCRPDERDALLGVGRRDGDRDRVPPSIHCRLNHIKVVHTHGADPEVKYYLFAQDSGG